MADDSTTGAVRTKNPSPLVYDKEKNKECKFEETTTTDENNKDKDCRKTVIYVDSEGYLQNAKITRNTISELNKGRIEFINAVVLHRTALSGTAKIAFNGFKTGTGSQFIIDNDGTIYQTESLSTYTWHVGYIKPRCEDENSCTPTDVKELNDMHKIYISKKKSAHTKEARKKVSDEYYESIHKYEIKKDYPIRYPYNGDAIGIEVVCLYIDKGKHAGSWTPITEAQKKSINRLVDILMNIYELSEKDIYGHDKISRKTPGEGDGLYGNN